MNAVVVRGIGEVTVETVEDARIEAPTDILLRVTSSAICGTDLHIYEGRMGDATGMVIGHEPLGVVEEAGPAVVSIRKGDRVTVPTHICCGFCVNCVRGFTDACLTVNPGNAGGAYGYPGMGGYRGTDTELVRVPFADMNCLRLPGEPRDDWEHDFVLLADAFPTGYHATELAQVSPGNSVAIFGAGAIGLLAAQCAIQLRGASEVYVVDTVPARLEKAGEIGAIPIDFSAGDPVEQIQELRSRTRNGTGQTYQGEEVMNGVDCGIDAIGFQAHDWNQPDRENPDIVIHALAQLINPTGRLGIIGVFLPHDARPNSELGARGD
ncbi:MAG TPA: alcohol dehydrogenase catalytic domain-containing protein, partial [Chloroflexota bacterium]